MASSMSPKRVFRRPKPHSRRTIGARSGWHSPPRALRAASSTGRMRRWVMIRVSPRSHSAAGSLYRGNLRGAMEAFRVAGPYAADRAAATERTAMMALLQRIQEESSPELGAALLTLARGDSVAGVAALRRAASRLPVQGGRLEVLLLAGQVAAQKGGDQEATAVALFDEIVRAGGEGAAPPAAELEWARLLVRTGRSAEAVPHLEHLILTYPIAPSFPRLGGFSSARAARSPSHETARFRKSGWAVGRLGGWRTRHGFPTA